MADGFVAGILRSILRSLTLLKSFHQPFKQFQPRDEMLEVGVRKDSSTRMVAPLLDAYFASPIKNDSIDRRIRIRNALHLLIQSDQQRHTAIGIALSVAAIEALVCGSSENIANTFAENSAVILEPDPNYRAAAVDFAKDLYNVRSRVLHGDVLEHEATVRRNSRILAAAILQAILERRDFQRRVGEDSDTPDKLLKELRRGKWIPGQLTGVSPSPVRQLWGAPVEPAQSNSKNEGESAIMEDDETDSE